MKLPTIKISWPLWARITFKAYMWFAFVAVELKLMSKDKALEYGETFVKKHMKFKIC